MTESEPLQTEQAGKTGSLRTRLLVLLILLPFLILAMVYLVTSLHLVFARNDTSYPEGASVYAFLTALRTGRLYSSPFDFPYNAQIYGPVFYLAGLVLAKVAHGDPMLTTELYRLLSFLSFLGAAGIAGSLSWKLEMKGGWAAVSIVLGLACVWTIPFSACVRPDALSILLILAALAVYQAAEGRSRLVFWAGVLGSLSWLTKQNTAPVLLALTIDTLIARRLRNTAALIAGSVPIPAIILCALWLRREPFLANFLILRNLLFDWHTGLLMAINLLRTNQMAVIPISLATLGIGLNWRKEKYRAILLAGGLGCISSLAALGNIGGAANYFILPWMLMILMVPAGLARVGEWTRLSIPVSVGLALLGGLLLMHQRNLLFQDVPADLDTRNVENLKILSGWPYLEMRSRQPQLLDPFLYRVLSIQHLWSCAPIVEQVDGEEFDLILIAGSDGPGASEFQVKSIREVSGWGGDMLGPTVSHYRALCEFPGSLALVPRDRDSGVRDKDITRVFGQPCRATVRTPQLAPGMR
jgi:hypothetical protein